MCESDFRQQVLRESKIWLVFSPFLVGVIVFVVFVVFAIVDAWFIDSVAPASFAIAAGGSCGGGFGAVTFANVFVGGDDNAHHDDETATDDIVNISNSCILVVVLMSAV